MYNWDKDFKSEQYIQIHREWTGCQEKECWKTPRKNLICIEKTRWESNRNKGRQPLGKIEIQQNDNKILLILSLNVNSK